MTLIEAIRTAILWTLLVIVGVWVVGACAGIVVLGFRAVTGL